MTVAAGQEERGALAAGQGRLSRLGEVMRLALPAAGELLLSMAVGLVNTYLVGHLGAASLAAVGLASQWLMTATVLFSAVGTGATALIARLVGARDREGANRVLGQALVVAYATGLLATACLVLLAGPALTVMGAEEAAWEQGVAYLRIVSSAFMLAAVMFIGNACMRGAGDTRTPMAIMTVVNLLNVVVSWTLINGVAGLPALGVRGAALGELAGRAAGGLLVVVLLLQGRAGLALRWADCRPDPVVMRRMLRVGLPAGFEQLVFRVGMLGFARAVAALGTAAYAAHQVALNAESLSFMPGFGFAVAATTLVGQGLGARDEGRAQRDGYTAFALSAVLMGAIGVVFVLFPRPLVAVFTDDPEVVALGAPPLRLIGLVQPFLAASMVFAGGLRGAGDTLAPMLINGGAVWILRLPLVLLFTQVLPWGLTGAWLAMAVDLMGRGTLVFLRFRGGRWKRAQV
ncbi:MAG: MATE family efflux transporter [Candidatus Latescibacterota bacterium]